MINNSKKKDEALSLLGKYAPEMAAMKSQLKMTDKHIDNLEQALSDMNRIDNRQRDTIYDQKQEISGLKDKLTELNYKQSQLQKIIDKIPSEVLEQMRNEEQQKRKESREER